MNNYKKILIISSWAPPRIGGPQNLYNLLISMPKGSYSILTSYFGIDNYSAQKGTWLPEIYHFYDNPKLKDSEETRKKMSQQSKNRERVSWFKYKVKKLHTLKILTEPFLILGQIIAITIQGIKVIKENKIEIFVGISDFGPAMISSYFIHKKTRRPFMLYFFDIYSGNNLSGIGNILAKIFEPKLFKYAEKIIVTNDGTKDFYVKRYGESIAKKIIVIYNSVFPESYSKVKNDTRLNPQPPYNILFTGSIYWPQIESLKNLIQVVNEATDLAIQLKIYSPSPKNYLKEIGIEESNRVHLFVATPQEMPVIQSQADILFLPLSWNTPSPQIVETATPGKLTDYLIAGKPMLIHAPASTFLVQYAKQNNFACCVDRESKELLKDGIKRLLTDTQYIKNITDNARVTFFKNHDANKNQIIFKNLFFK